MGKLRHPMEMKQPAALHQRQVRPGIHCLVNAVELRRVVEVGHDFLVTMCPLMDGRPGLLPDQELDQRHSMCNLAALCLRVSGARYERCRDTPPRIAAQSGTRCLTATEAVTF